MKTILFIVGPALGHVGRSLVIARAARESRAGVRIVFAYVDPGFGSTLVRPEFECVPLSYMKPGDEGFSDGVELVVRNIDPELICLDLSPVPWLYLVRFPEVPRAYATNFFLTSLVSSETYQDRDLRDNFGD